MRILVSEDIWGFDLDEALKEISAQRREQALRFRYEEGERLCVLAYQLLRQALREDYGITAPPLFDYNEHGKPAIADHPEIFFNLSHCKEAALCAVSTKPIGADVEAVRPMKDMLVDYTMNEAEAAEIHAAENPDAAFIRLWTMKEATAKLVGTGITNDMKQLIDTRKYKYTTVSRQRYIYTIAEYLAI